MTDCTHSSQRLTPEGLQRSELMLAELILHMRHVQAQRSRRRRMTAASAVALLMALGGYASIQFNQERTPGNDPVLASGHPNLNTGSVSSILMLVQTDSSLLDRCRVSVDANYLIMNDETLLQTLDDIERPAGLIQIGQTVRLTRAIADPIGG